MTRTRPPRALDPHAPNVLDLRELPRVHGAHLERRCALRAPEGIRNPLGEIPAGSSVEASLRLEAVGTGVLVTSTLTASLEAECARCLEPVSLELAASFQELASWSHPGAASEDEEPWMVADGLLDLTPRLRDALGSALPLAPLCDPDCPGLCPDCGVLRAELPADHTHEQGDPRWAVLDTLR